MMGGRPLTLRDIANKKYDTLPLEDEWFELLGQPERTGRWFIWGNSGNGKTNFVLQLCKALRRFGKVLVFSLEESADMTFRDALFSVFRPEERGVFVWTPEQLPGGLEDIEQVLDRRGSPPFVVFDSIQCLNLRSYKMYTDFIRKYPNKLLVFTSQAEKQNPKGGIAHSVMHDAAKKIWVEGYKAFCKGRGKQGEYIIWAEGAKRYWGMDSPQDYKDRQ